ncbi:MarP family serine protease [Smaragdicoccus niigatensis]|uniref:MarP family serine protease n=1 Tax=Smaragdicoccus niigatensis TaxID=359359 RepID=UPI00036962F4|nr:MarP family serine protease [Smaragdicoccus niigatensis]
MSASGLLDLAIVLIAIIAATSGWRHGAVASFMAFVGVLAGAYAGIEIAPHVLTHIDQGRARLVVGIFLIVALVILGELVGMVIGGYARNVIRTPIARAVDSSVGAVLQAAAVLFAAWLLAIPLTGSSQPEIAAAVRGSEVLQQVDKIAPQWVKEIPKDFEGLLDTSGLPDIIGPFGSTPIATVEKPDAAILTSPVVRQLQNQVLRIRGTAHSCQRALEGSGFVIARERVMTNAHVVAGTDYVAVDTSNGPLDAKVVLFDPETDVAILDVPGLTQAPLAVAPSPAETGQDAIVLGYPGGGDYTASAARVRETLDLTGPDIYRNNQVEREVYTVRGLIRQGNSGGPLVDTKGRLLGVVFGAAVDNSDTGFVLTLHEVRDEYNRAPGLHDAVATGDCVN